MKPLNSLYFRLVVPLGITLLVAMLAAWAIGVHLLGSTFDSQLDERLQHATEILAEGEFPFSADLLKRADRLIEARILLLDASADIKLSTATGATAQALADIGDRLGANTDSGVTLLTIESDTNDWRVAIRPLPPSRDIRFSYVATAASLADSREATTDAAIFLGAAMLLATILLAWFGHYFARSITVPVGDLASMADRIAAGDREIASSFEADDEIGLLARALNRMAGRLRQYEDDLAQQSRMAGLGDLAARLAHEIRNPLTAIKMQLQLLAESVPGDEVERVQSLLNEIRRMEIIVQSALAFGAPLAIERQDIAVDTLIADLIDLLQPALEHRRIELRRTAQLNAVISADPDRLRQVLLNLINNAADEMPDGGIIEVSAVPVEGRHAVDICIEDSGPGMQEDGTRSDKPFGLGLGLTICREIIEQHDGELLQSRSTNLGGASFTIRLQRTD